MKDGNGDEIIIKVGRRLAITESKLIDWYEGYSSRNDNSCAEGKWSEWVELAKAILEKDKVKKEKELAGVEQINE